MQKRLDHLYKIGYQDGVYDQDDKLPKLTEAPDWAEAEYGQKYKEGYNAGYEIAKNRAWYIVSLKEVNKKFVISSYMIDLGKEGNDWTKDKDKATRYATRQLVEDRLKSMSGNRGTYSFSWEDIRYKRQLAE